jgi:hypothetical protein
MPSRRIRLVTLGLAAPALLALGVVVTSSGTAPRAAAAEGEGTKKDAKVDALREERLAVLKDLAVTTRALFQRHRASLSELVEVSRAARRAELDQCDTDKERVAVLEKALAAAQETEEFVKAKVMAGRASGAETLRARANRLEIEIALARVKAQ